MPALTEIAVDDRESTPVTHTFQPSGFKDEVALFRESDGTPVGDRTLTVSTRRTQNGLYKVRIVLGMPTTVTETVNGVDQEKVVRAAYADLTFTFSESSTMQERKNVCGIVHGLLADDEPTMTAVLEDLENLW